MIGYYLGRLSMELDEVRTVEQSGDGQIISSEAVWNGLLFKVQPDKVDYKVGEPVKIRLSLTNTRIYSRKLTTSGLGSGGDPAVFNVAILYTNGTTALRLECVQLAMMGQVGIPPLGSLIRTKTWDIYVSTIDVCSEGHLAPAGNYLIQANAIFSVDDLGSHILEAPPVRVKVGE